ncbi:uncharacterized protein LOC132714042 [Ruditapes philippinarum]|uniref:uncharacterized protein LOC132714042 n=1 Tax=Ruditapes philippinarum TaxID=129788 RepID=UPI00295BFB68|nr:uncharacterized protein LOC132714042 [Ruditapes philippinarum]
MATSILNVTIAKCKQFAGVKKICAFPNNALISDIFFELHGSVNSADLKNKIDNLSLSVVGSTSPSCTDFKDLPEVDSSLCVTDIVQFGLRSLFLRCKEEPTLLESVAIAAEAATHKAANAFELLMEKGRVFPDKKSTSSGVKSGTVNVKDVLYNKLVDLFVMKHLDFPKGSKEEGQYLVQLIFMRFYVMLFGM